MLEILAAAVVLVIELAIIILAVLAAWALALACVAAVVLAFRVIWEAIVTFAPKMAHSIKNRFNGVSDWMTTKKLERRARKTVKAALATEEPQPIRIKPTPVNA